MAPSTTKSNPHLNSRPPRAATSISTSRLRKTFNPQFQTTINTNLSAHPRTNPTSALSVLLKLLTSLPSRIGGCQYKLTPAEHTLSLHLVSIIDPFVYHGLRALAPPQHAQNQASIVNLVNQPTEILDAIIFHIDSRRDLLNVALGCKRLHGVVFPRHFEYRLIRCKVSSISVWNHLILHRSLARNVRRLEILDERSSASTGGNFTKGRGILVPKNILQGDTDLESTDDELSMHVKQEKYLAAALVRMTGLREFQWSCNHSPISIAHVWPTLMMRAVNLRVMDIYDNLVFAPKVDEDDDGADQGDRESESESESEGENDERGQSTNSCQGVLTRVPNHILGEMKSVTFRSTSHSYGAAKQPELSHISGMLHRCINLKDLEITYISPRLSTSIGHQGTPFRARPLADEFLMYSRWANLTSLILTNLRCASSLAPSAFLSAHSILEVLHMDISINLGGGAGATPTSPLQLSPGSLPHLREIKASREIINAILECPLPSSSSSPSCARPLESVKGFKLSGNGNSAQQSSSRSISDSTFLSNLKQTAHTIRRIEMVGWHDMDDIKKLIACIPNVQYLDVGKRLGGAAATQRHVSSPEKGVAAPATNMAEWAELLATLPDLTSMHGVKFFYEVSSVTSTTNTPSNTNNNTAYSNGQAPISTPGLNIIRDASPVSQSAHTSKQGHTHTQMSLSMMERSRMRKNDEIAGVLAWKCKKLRRLDHWDESSGKVIVLLRDHEHGHVGGGMHGEDVGIGKEKLTSTTAKVRWEVRRLKT
ncbi:hypothetical protein BYT27DRAFT_7191043 [Phlegmacium glaucopus]|nr:hypothetical protein BYT27DRAFT_7191043 [Phlegmacium glaucopus]